MAYFLHTDGHSLHEFMLMAQYHKKPVHVISHFNNTFVEPIFVTI